MATDQFILCRDRDAYGTIRGYVYQVDLTIRRWLDLEENQHLELERGEDIDLVSRAFNSTDSSETKRLLEQVKHRENHLTLRDPAALGAIATAVEHISTNPTLDLWFCYTTNTKITTERPAPFPQNIPGINFWEKVRRGELAERGTSEAVGHLKRFLSQANRPSDLDEDVWNNFQSFLAARDDRPFLNLVTRFEWSTSGPSAHAAGCAIPELLMEWGLAQDAMEAEQMYHRLFVYVLKLLCQPDVKRLTRADLERQLLARTLSATDHAIVTRLGDCFSLLQMRVSEVETAVMTISNDVRRLAGRDGIHGTLLRGLAVATDLTLPPEVNRLSVRNETVTGLIPTLESRLWSAFWGASDTGKSQLVLLIIKRRDNCKGWIRFSHTMQPGEAEVVLDSALATLGGIRRLGNAPGWYLRSCERIGAGSLLVLDDLPRLHGTDPLSQRLVILADACRSTGLRLLSTSHHPLPEKLRSIVGDENLCEFTVPMLTESETSEVLAAHGAPAGFLNQPTIRLVHTLASHGHPLLVRLSADYLRGRSWQLSDTEIRGLFQGEHAERIGDEVLGRIVTTLDEQQRELLFRLTIPLGPFDLDVVNTLAGVTPMVACPREVLDGLLGAWVQRDAERKLVVSPLVRGVGNECLSPGARTGCHLVVAEMIVRRTMSIYEAQQAISHFCQGRAFDRAGTLLLFLLDQARTLEAGMDIGLFASMWAESALPEEMDLGIRIIARSMQLSVLPKYNRPTGYIIADLDRLLGMATDTHSWAIASAVVHAVVHFVDLDLERAMRYLLRALALSEIRRPDGDGIVLPENMRIDDLLWLIVPRVDTAARLDAWMSAVESLAPERRQSLLGHEHAPFGCMVVADRLVGVEAKKPVTERNWEIVLAALSELRERARRLGASILQAASVRSALIVYGEYLHRIADGEVQALAAMDDFQDDAAAIALVAGMLGRQNTFANRHDVARPMLTVALKQTHTSPYEKLLNLMAASQCFGVENAEEGVEYARQAVELSRFKVSITGIDVARALAELAVAKFLQSETRAGAIAAFESWSEAVDRMLDCQEETDDWQNLFVVFAHTNSYFTAMADSGHPPLETRDGTPFAGPTRGVFLGKVLGRTAYYRASSVPAVMWLLTQYAMSAGNSLAAANWLARASSAAIGSNLTFVQAMIGHDLIPNLVEGDQYPDAIDAALKCCQVIKIYGATAVPKRDPLDEGVEITSALAGMSVAEREAIERAAVLMAVVPAACRIGFLVIQDRESGYNSGRSLAAICREVSDTAADPGLWTDTATILDRFCRDDASVKELVAIGNNYNEDYRLAPRILAYLGASLHGTPDEAFNAQLSIMRVLYQFYPPNSRSHRQLLLPFIQKFWTTSFRQARFLFSSPKLVGERLELAEAVPVEKRLKTVLNAVRLGVRVEVPAETVNWLISDIVLPD